MQKVVVLSNPCVAGRGEFAELEECSAGRRYLRGLLLFVQHDTVEARTFGSVTGLYASLGSFIFGLGYVKKQRGAVVLGVSRRGASAIDAWTPRRRRVRDHRRRPSGREDPVGQPARLGLAGAPKNDRDTWWILDDLKIDLDLQKRGTLLASCGSRAAS